MALGWAAYPSCGGAIEPVTAKTLTHNGQALRLLAAEIRLVLRSLLYSDLCPRQTCTIQGLRHGSSLHTRDLVVHSDSCNQMTKTCCADREHLFDVNRKSRQLTVDLVFNRETASLCGLKELEFQ
jgi:hypothetical protein